jgi:hypothetical protein
MNNPNPVRDRISNDLLIKLNDKVVRLEKENAIVYETLGEALKVLSRLEKDTLCRDWYEELAKALGVEYVPEKRTKTPVTKRTPKK